MRSVDFIGQRLLSELGSDFALDRPVRRAAAEPSGALPGIVRDQQFGPATRWVVSFSADRVGGADLDQM